MICCRHKGNNDHCVDVSSTIVDGPLDKTVYSRSTVSFHCTSDGLTDIYWKYSEAAGHSVYVFGHRGRNEQLFDARFVKTVNGFTSILTIRDVQTSDAGIYKCRESNSDNPLSAKLTVIG